MEAGPSSALEQEQGQVQGEVHVQVPEREQEVEPLLMERFY